MAYIYAIVNDINNKIYVGKTNLTVEKRFKEHCRDSKRPSEENRPLYTAMQKYGIEHFSAQELEQCSTEEASAREAFWIKHYQSYENGYNATFGGDGKQLFSHEQIAHLLKKIPYPVEVAELVGCSPDTVYIVAKEYEIEVKNRGHFRNQKRIAAYQKDGAFVKDFDSVQLAGEWCAAAGYCAAMNSGVRSHIAEAANGKRKSAYGFLWKYI